MISIKKRGRRFDVPGQGSKNHTASPGDESPFFVMTTNSCQIPWREVILKVPELGTITVIIIAYLYLLPGILSELKDADSFRFGFVLLFVSGIVGASCVLLLIQHSTRIAQEEVRKSRVALDRVTNVLSKLGIEPDSTGDRAKQ